MAVSRSEALVKVHLWSQQMGGHSLLSLWPPGADDDGNASEISLEAEDWHHEVSGIRVWHKSTAQILELRNLQTDCQRIFYFYCARDTNENSNDLSLNKQRQ